MFYLVSFGNNTRTYLYKSNVIEGEIGMAVIVPTGKSGNKEGVIVDVLSAIPENIPFAEKDIKEIVCRSYEEICDDIIKKYLVQRFFDAHILSRLFLTSIFPVKCFGC